MSITATICQPRYLPYLGYFDRMLKSDVFIVLDCVKFAPQDWENRNKIKSAAGTAQWLSVPVKASTSTKVSRVEIDDTLPWRRKHQATIEQAYGKAKCFDEFSPMFRHLESPWYYLEALNEAIVDTCVEILDIKTPRLKATDIMRWMEPESEAWGKGSELLLNLCKTVGATTYFSGAPGLNYLDVTLFNDHGIKVFFQEYKTPIYPQVKGDFIPNLAVIDLIFNCGEASKDIIRGKSC